MPVTQRVLFITAGTRQVRATERHLDCVLEMNATAVS